MTRFLENLKEIEQLQKIKEKTKGTNLENLIILDPEKDPDPLGIHGISLTDRLKAMGWP